MCEKKSSFFEGVLTGVAIGITGYVLMTTDQGKKITKDLKKKVAPYVDDVADLLEELKDKNSELLDRAEELKSAIEEKVEEVKEDLTPAVTKQLEKSLTSIEDLQERGRKAVAAIRKHKLFFKNTPKKA